MGYVPPGGETNFLIPIPQGEGRWRIPVVYARKRSFIVEQLDFGWLQQVRFLVPSSYEEPYRPFVSYTPDLPR